MFRLTKLREAKGWSRSELARRTKINQPTISVLESGKIFPYPKWKRLIAEALEVDPEILFQEVENDGESN